MPAAGEQYRLGLVATHKVAFAPAPSTRLAAGHLRETLHAEKAQVGHVQAAVGQVLHRQGPALVIAPALLQCWPFHLPADHIPPHKQLEAHRPHPPPPPPPAPHPPPLLPPHPRP